MSKLLVIKTGTAQRGVRGSPASPSDFDTWIAEGAGLPPEGVWAVEVFRDEPLPDPSSVPGVIVSGSSAMVTSRAA